MGSFAKRQKRRSASRTRAAADEHRLPGSRRFAETLASVSTRHRGADALAVLAEGTHVSTWTIEDLSNAGCEFDRGAAVARFLSTEKRPPLVEIARLLLTPHPDVQAAALAVLTSIPFVAGVKLAAPLLDSPSAIVRAHALRLLAAAHRHGGALDAADEARALSRTRDDTSPAVREARAAYEKALVPSTEHAVAVPSTPSAIAAMLSDTPVPDVVLIKTLIGAPAGATRALVAAVGALPSGALARALGGLFVVGNDDVRGLAADVAKRLADKLDPASRARASMAIADLLVDAGPATSLSCLRALVALDVDHALTTIIRRADTVDEFVICDLADAAEPRGGPAPTPLDVAPDVLCAALVRQPALHFAVAGRVHPPDDEALRRTFFETARRATHMAQDRMTTVGNGRVNAVAFALSLARAPFPDGCLPPLLDENLNARHDALGAMARVALARAHRCRRSADVLVALLSSPFPEASSLAEKAISKFRSRLARIDRTGERVTVIDDARSSDGELLVVDGTRFRDGRGRTYAVDANGSPVSLHAAPFGACQCCAHAHVVEPWSTGVVCPVTGARHLRDATRGWVLASSVDPEVACPDCPTDVPRTHQGIGFVCEVCAPLHASLQPTVAKSSTTRPNDQGDVDANGDALAGSQRDATDDDSRPLDVDATPIDRAVIGIPPAPRALELDGFRPAPRQIVAAHLFLATNDSVLGAGVVIGQDAEHGTITALFMIDDVTHARISEDGGRVFAANGAQAPLKFLRVGDEDGIVVVTATLRRVERIQVATPDDTPLETVATVLIPGGAKIASWEVASVRLVDDNRNSDAGTRRQLKGAAHRAGAGVYSLSGHLLGLVDVDGRHIVSFAEVRDVVARDVPELRLLVGATATKAAASATDSHAVPLDE